MRTETRPWGRFEVIYEDEHCWLKRIFIAPGQSLSYQTHAHRTEFWLAETPGVRAVVRDFDMVLHPTVTTPFAVMPGVKHRLYNSCDHEVSVIEWAIGLPDEADIVRISDDYGR